VVALHGDDVARHRAEACTGDEACPECVQAENPALSAMCEAGRCELLDVRSAALSACSTAEDCVLRRSGCCECSAGEWIALRADGVAGYASAVCDPESACATCEPIAPTDVEAICAADGHCDVRIL
jgi:hypothetical protein